MALPSHGEFIAGHLFSYMELDQDGYDEACAICQDIFDAPLELFCGHIFCANCLLTWLDTSATCPSCRTTLFDPSTLPTARLLHLDRNLLRDDPNFAELCPGAIREELDECHAHQTDADFVPLLRDPNLVWVDCTSMSAIAVGAMLWFRNSAEVRFRNSDVPHFPLPHQIVFKTDWIKIVRRVQEVLRLHWASQDLCCKTLQEEIERNVFYTGDQPMRRPWMVGAWELPVQHERWHASTSESWEGGKEFWACHERSVTKYIAYVVWRMQEFVKEQIEIWEGEDEEDSGDSEEAENGSAEEEEEDEEEEEEESYDNDESSEEEERNDDVYGDDYGQEQDDDDESEELDI